ncbi:MAG TPA: hypothetical protein DHW36_05860 [Thalassospira sp.]|nr:hypothetical protein [Thalassospira sp.]
MTDQIKRHADKYAEAAILIEEHATESEKRFGLSIPITNLSVLAIELYLKSCTGNYDLFDVQSGQKLSQDTIAASIEARGISPTYTKHSSAEYGHELTKLWNLMPEERSQEISDYRPGVVEELKALEGVFQQSRYFYEKANSKVMPSGLAFDLAQDLYKFFAKSTALNSSSK